MPTPRKNKEILKTIEERIDKGIYNLGVPIMEREFQKPIITKEGKLESKTVKFCGRKIPLRTIREKALQRDKEFLRLRTDEEYARLSDESVQKRLDELFEPTSGSNEDKRNHLKRLERQRFWMLWHDHSSLANNGFMLFLVRQLYDPAIHLTTKEYKEKTGKSVDIQATIEQPHLYIMGKSASTQEEQLLFIETRKECLKAISASTEIDGIQIVDTMRVMNGDNPAVQFESGNQKGGNYACAGCDGHMNMVQDYQYMTYRQHRTLHEYKQLVLAGTLAHTRKV